MLIKSPLEIDTAMALGATSGYPKRSGAEALQQLAKTITVRWWFLTRAAESGT